jgi:hypothetical protein
MTLEICWRNPVPPRKTKSSVQEVASKNDGAVYAISRSNRKSSNFWMEWLATSGNRARSAILVVMPGAARRRFFSETLQGRYFFRLRAATPTPPVCR